MPRRPFLRLLAAAAPPGDHVPDSELMRRFASARDSAAFELIVRRHADAVWAAGYRVLRNAADADDAFQATFLALARKAGSVRGSCVGGWLHRVAVNAALKLRANRDREGAGVPVAVAPIDPDRSPEQAEAAAVVHQELARLPDRYRLPVVLCDLEGHTLAEAAKALGWPVGSVSGRLSRAHGILRDRLARRGLAAPAVLLVAAVAPPATVSAALLAASGAAVSPVVLSLTEGVLSAMRIAKLKLTATVLAASGLIALAGLGTGYALTRMPAPAGPNAAAGEQQPPPKADAPIEGNWVPKSPQDPVPTAFPDLEPPDANKAGLEKAIELMAKTCPQLLGDVPPAIDPTDDTLRRLLKARIQQGRLELAQINQIIRVGRWDSTWTPSLMECLTDMRRAAVELWSSDPKRLEPWLQEFVVVSKWIEQFFSRRVDAGNEVQFKLNTARRHRLEAEAALWRAKHAQRQGGR